MTLRLVPGRVVRVDGHSMAAMGHRRRRVPKLRPHHARIHDAGRECEQPGEQHMKGEPAKTLSLHRG